ncbi:MAG: HAD family hydrolase [Opitutales bacterium]
MAPCKHVIWDWNGTLLDDTWLCVEVLNTILEKRGAPGISRHIYRENFGFPVVHFYKYLGFATDDQSFDKVSREFIETYEKRWLRECSLHHEADATLARLRAAGVTHSVLSAARQQALDQGIQHFGIRRHFHGLVGADNIHARGKTEEGRNWIARLHWEPEDVVLVGDTLHDFEVAEAIGVRCVLMAHGHQSEERLARSGAPVVHSLTELLERLQAFCHV